MEIISLEDIADIYDSISLELMELDDEKDYIAVYGKRDLICELFAMMITDGYSFKYADCDFMDEILKDRVYMMFVREDCGVSIEPAISSKGVVMSHDAKTAFIFMDDIIILSINNFLSSKNIKDLIDKGYIEWNDLKSIGINEKFINYIKRNDRQKIEFGYRPLSKIEKESTEIYFWGIPSSGKSCA